MSRHFLFVSGILSSLVFTATLAAQCELEVLAASDPGPGESFASAIAIHGHRVIVGAWRDDDACNGSSDCNSGSAYVFRYDGSGWHQEQKLTASDAVADDRFGWSVGANERSVLVGAPGDYLFPGAGEAGSVYAFRHDGVEWVETQKLFSSDAYWDDRFGHAISVSEDTAVIGAPTGLTDFEPGAAYIFRFDGKSWREEELLAPSDGVDRGRFGQVVLIQGDRAFVGAERDSTNVGAVYVYHYNGTSWIEEQKLTASDARQPDPFGNFFGGPISVRSDGQLLAIGAPGDNSACPCPPGQDFCCWSGAVYVYGLEGGEWVEKHKLISSEAAPHQRFGSSASFAGGLLAVSATQGSPHQVYFLRYDGSTWFEEAKLALPDGPVVAAHTDVIALGMTNLNSLAGGVELYAYEGADCDGNGQVDLCDIVVSSSRDLNANLVLDGCEDFIRGDVDADGSVMEITDGVFLLAYEFIPGSPEPPCLDAADTDDNGRVSGLVDGVYLLRSAFVPGSPLPPPPQGPSLCGVDPTLDQLGCEVFPCP